MKNSTTFEDFKSQLKLKQKILFPPSETFLNFHHQMQLNRVIGFSQTLNLTTEKSICNYSEEYISKLNILNS